MKKLRKLTAVLLVLLMVTSLVTVSVTPTIALTLTAKEKKVRVYGNLKYDTIIINEDEDDTSGDADEKVVRIVGYKGKPEKLTIPAKINGMRVISIQKDAFAKCTSLKKLVVKAKADILQGAFRGCKNLKTVDLGKAQYLGYFVFKNNKKLTTVKITKSQKGLWGNAFVGCTALKKFTVASDSKRFKAKDGVVYSKDGTELIAYPAGKKNRFSVPAGVTRVAARTFEGYTNMKVIYAGNDVVYIGERAFKGCTNLETAKIGSKVVRVETAAFMNCTALTKINLRNVRVIEPYAFKNTGFKYIEIPKDVEYISKQTFANCKSLVDVELSENTEYIGTQAFANCTSLTEITMTEGFMIYVEDKAFAGCTALKNVSFGSEFRAIYKKVFLNCPELKTVMIPEHIHTIDDYALGYIYKDGEYTKVDGFRMYGYAGTIAETYATENGFEFISLPALPQETQPAA